MEKKIIPFFEVDGKRYEIRRTRYVLAEFEKRKEELSLSADEEKEYVKEQDKNKQLEKLSQRKEELYEKYLDTFNEEDEEKYKRASVAYDTLLNEISAMKNIMGAYHKKIIDLGEQLIIASLQWDDNGKTIRTLDEANQIWNSYVDEVGKNSATEFVAYTTQYLVGGDEDEQNPFVAQAKARAEQTMQRKQGLNKIK